VNVQRGLDAAKFYKERTESRIGPVSQDPAAAAEYYDRYVRFVSEYLPRGGSLLELGSATGMAAACLAAAGYRTTATDLGHAFFRTDLRSSTLHFAAADSLSLPFRDAAFDGVASFQTLEHVPDPQRALDEMLRVVKPGGWIFVAGPNLLGLIPSLHLLLYVIPRYRPLRLWFRRDEPHIAYPFGSTYPDIATILVKNVGRIVWKLVDRNVTFLTRTPDYRVPMHADADSAYLLNPIDIVKYLRGRACTIASSRGRGWFGVLGPLAGGTWVAARRKS
jgi:SAM-dependent methyltransferase